MWCKRGGATALISVVIAITTLNFYNECKLFIAGFGIIKP
ncbi:hypothetical protein GAMM_50013 [Gammaproteobacteria bacterium]